MCVRWGNCGRNEASLRTPLAPEGGSAMYQMFISWNLKSPRVTVSSHGIAKCKYLKFHAYCHLSVLFIALGQRMMDSKIPRYHHTCFRWRMGFSLKERISGQVSLSKICTPRKLLEVVFRSLLKFKRTFLHSLLIFSSKHPMKALFILDKGQLCIWKFTILDILNLDSVVFKSFLKQHSQTIGGNLRLHSSASWCHLGLECSSWCHLGQVS